MDCIEYALISVILFKFSCITLRFSSSFALSAALNFCSRGVSAPVKSIVSGVSTISISAIFQLRKNNATAASRAETVPPTMFSATAVKQELTA